MLNQNIVKVFSLALFAMFITVGLSASALAQGGERLSQGTSPEPDFGLLSKGEPLSDIEISLGKKPKGSLSAGNFRTDHDGKFNLGYLAPGVYSITLDITANSATQLEAQMAKTYSESKSNTAARAMVTLDGVKSMAVITSIEMQRSRFLGPAAPALTQVYEIQFEVVGRSPVTGTVSIAIGELGVK
ncbi:MAG: hypothetical protein M3X11_11810 [Acidobacteriota bacterium]|nr:hypothetical protein [Acidobacteriota bacterium]